MPGLVLAAAHALEQRGEIVGVLLFLGEDFLQHAPGGGILLAEVVDHLAVAVDGDALGDQVFLDHVLERVAFDVLGMAARGEALGREVRLAVELRDTCGDLVGVLLLVLRVLEELRRHALGVDALRHEIVALIAQRTHDLGGKRLVQQPHHRVAVGLVARRHRALRDVLAGAATEFRDVGQERLGGPAPARLWRRTHFVVLPEVAEDLASFCAYCFLMSACACSCLAFACFWHAFFSSPFMSSHFSLATSYSPSALASATLRWLRGEGSFFASSSALATFSWALASFSHTSFWLPFIGSHFALAAL